MSVRRELTGFMICMVAGMLVSFAAMVVMAIAELPDALRDSRDTFDVRRMIFVAVAFATVFAIARIVYVAVTANRAS